MHDNNIECIKKAQAGDKDAMTKLINNNQGLIWNIVKRFTGRNFETEDLYQIGCIGFIKSIKRFDTSYEVQLSTYAVPYILGEIKRHIRDDGMVKVSRSTKELGVRIKNIQNEYLKKNKKEISIIELAKQLKVDKEEIIFAIDAGKQVISIFQEEQNDNEDKNELISKLPASENQEINIINSMALKQVIDNLNTKEKQIIFLHYFKDKTQSEIGKMLGISQVQVSRIEKKV